MAKKAEPKRSQDVIRLNADVDVETFKRLRHALVEDRVTFAKWLRKSIDAYLKEKAPRKRRSTLASKRNVGAKGGLPDGK